MPSTFLGLNIAMSGLYAYQAAINTTGHNVANAGVRGYTRQQVNMAASRAISINNRYGMVGTGVDITGIVQTRNEYYDAKFRSNNCIYGEYESKRYYMTSLENYYNEEGADGITASFDDFNNALVTLQGGGGDPTKRREVANYGKNFTELVSYLSNRLQSVQEECNNEIRTTADQINAIAESIASLNLQINNIEIYGNKANDLRDARSLLIEELSELGKVTVSEEEVAAGVSRVVVRFDNKPLVDNYDYNTLICSKDSGNKNQGDIDGLYSLKWSDGQDFNAMSPTLGGKLQALYEFRDGNNQDVLNGTMSGKKGDMEVVMTGSSCNNLSQLNIPPKDGKIVIDNREYEYSSFKVEVQADGSFKYSFSLKQPLVKDADAQNGQVGDKIAYKGVPYYMAQLNDFIRTYSSSFNDLHNQGKTSEGKSGADFFTGTFKSSGQNMELTEKMVPGTIFSSVLAVDGDGNLIANGEGYVPASYYHLTAANFSVDKKIIEDPNNIAISIDNSNGIEDTGILEKLVALKSDSTMFREGTPDSYLRGMVVELGIDAKTANTFSVSQKNILDSIEYQRASVAGVDKDEEGINLIKYQQAYRLSAKVVEVMNEIYDRMINGMGV